MDIDFEEVIRLRAYAIWEEEGRPEGEDLRHWHQAAGEMRGDASAEAASSEATSDAGETDQADEAPSAAEDVAAIAAGQSQH